jgi:hypothetical protein
MNRRLTVEKKDGMLKIIEHVNGNMNLITEVSESFFNRAMAQAGFISMPFYTLPEWQERNEKRSEK